MAVGDRVACITDDGARVKGDAWSGRPRLAQAGAPRSRAAFHTHFECERPRGPPPPKSAGAAEKALRRRWRREARV